MENNQDALNRIAQNEKDIVMLKTLISGENGIINTMKEIRDAQKANTKFQNMALGALIIINIIAGFLMALGLKLI